MGGASELSVAVFRCRRYTPVWRDGSGNKCLREIGDWDTKAAGKNTNAPEGILGRILSRA